MDHGEAKKVFDKLYENVNGRLLSLQGREGHQYKSKSFVYGEVLFDSFFQMISEAEPKPGQVFYDLGSGTGKGVFLSHLLFDFSKSKGIEFVDALYQAASEVRERYYKEIRPTIAQDVGDKQVYFTFGNFLDVDVNDGDIFFMNSTCFQEDLMFALENKLSTLKPGSKVISLSKSFRSPAFEVYKHKMFEFSWGQATAFFHRKR